MPVLRPQKTNLFDLKLSAICAYIMYDKPLNENFNFLFICEIGVDLTSWQAQLTRVAVWIDSFFIEYLGLLTYEDYSTQTSKKKSEEIMICQNSSILNKFLRWMVIFVVGFCLLSCKQIEDSGADSATLKESTLEQGTLVADILNHLATDMLPKSTIKKKQKTVGALCIKGIWFCYDNKPFTNGVI